MVNDFKDTNIYGNFTVKPLYATYSNIGVSSGNVVVPAYFQNTGNTDLNNISISGVFNSTGTLGIGRDANTNFLTMGCTSNTLHSNAPDGGTYHGLSMVSTKLNPATSLFGFYSLAMGIDNTTGYSYINCSGSGATQPLCLNSRSGCVGIGTISPNTAKTLDVAGDVNISGTLDVNETAHIKGSSLFLGSGKTNLIYSDTNNPQEMVIQTKGQIYFNTGIDGSGSTPTTKLKINGDGKIGIGTYTPSELLDVNGNVNISGTLTCADISNTYLKIANYTSHSGNFTGNITLTSGVNTQAGVYLGKTTNLIYGYNDNLGIRCEGDFYFENSTNSSIMNLNGETSTLTVSNMVVNSKMGILTSTPTEALDVNGNVKCKNITTSKIKYTQEQVNVFTIPSNNFNIGYRFYRYILANYGFIIGLPNALDVGKVITVISNKSSVFQIFSNDSEWGFYVRNGNTYPNNINVYAYETINLIVVKVTLETAPYTGIYYDKYLYMQF